MTNSACAASVPLGCTGLVAPPLRHISPLAMTGYLHNDLTHCGGADETSVAHPSPVSRDGGWSPAMGSRPTSSCCTEQNSTGPGSPPFLRRTPMRTAVYVRVSTPRQSPTRTITRRFAHLLTLLRAQGVRLQWVLVLTVIPTPVCLDVISLVASSCGYYRGEIEQRVAH